MEVIVGENSCTLSFATPAIDSDMPGNLGHLGGDLLDLGSQIGNQALGLVDDAVNGRRDLLDLGRQIDNQSLGLLNQSLTLVNQRRGFRHYLGLHHLDLSRDLVGNDERRNRHAQHKQRQDQQREGSDADEDGERMQVAARSSIR